jgi:dihydroxyacetone kinase-like protein
MELSIATLLNWLRRAAALIHAQREHLTALDAAIGDADHGTNLDRGFTALLELLPTLEQADAGEILQTAGRCLISTVGGASGPLYGTAFRRAGTALVGRHAISGSDLVLATREFTVAVATLGKAQLGDKTMFDALLPAAEQLTAAVATGLQPQVALSNAARAARAGAEATIPLVARRGRASYLGERSAGHQDPGATSAALLFQALAEVA